MNILKQTCCFTGHRNISGSSFLLKSKLKNNYKTGGYPYKKVTKKDLINGRIDDMGRLLLTSSQMK